MAYEEIPEQCKPLCPFAGMNLLQKCLAASRNCKGPRVVEEGEVLSREVGLLPDSRAISYEGQSFTLEPRLACTNTGIIMTIEAQLDATAAKR